ncbi:MAG: GGDEF domain-containing protein [Desulfosudaceae bacterium]
MNKQASIHTPPTFIRLLTRLGSPVPLVPEERSKRISAVFLLLASTVVFVTFSLYHIYVGNYFVLMANAIALTGFVLLLLGLRRMERGLVLYWIMAFCFMLFCGIIVVLGRTEISYFLWIFIFPAVGFSILGARQGLAASLLFLVISIVLMSVPRSWLHTPPYSAYILVRSIVIYLTITLIFFYYETSQQILIQYIQREKTKFENASKVDALTGLANRRDIAEKLAIERLRQLRMGHPLTVILGDIDDFKHLNDTHGHDAGDHVLQRVAREMQRHTRDIDCPARWGGEEFLIMLVETDRESGRKVAERLRQTIAATRFRYNGRDLSVTMTFGVTSCQESENDIDACIKRADEAMYVGKKQGKNRVIAG